MQPSPEYWVFDPAAHSLRDSYATLASAIAPRPIAFASTLDAEGQPNLAPFSYFNVFSTIPPICIFGPVRSGRTGTHKNTLLNVKAVPEVCINLVAHGMVHQQNLAATEFPRGVDEFEKSGLTPLASDLIKPARVAESPIQLECRVVKVEELGDVGGAGNLVHCEVLRIHINKAILDEFGRIDPRKTDLVARLGGDWYARITPECLFRLPKPASPSCLGFDGLPANIRNSEILIANELAQMAMLGPELLTPEAIQHFMAGEGHGLLAAIRSETEAHQLARHLISNGRPAHALQLLAAASA